MISNIQLSANRVNAKKSTGPISETGKKAISLNAVKHGIFSKQLILKNENSQEYENLFSGLSDELLPMGILESTLVEKIAVNLWRQKRLIKAESATIELELLESEAPAIVINKPPNDYQSVDYDQDFLDWCNVILNEGEQLDSSSIDINLLESKAPYIFKQLQSEADEDKQSFKQYLNDWESIADYVKSLTNYCQQCLDLAKQQQVIKTLSELVRMQQLGSLSQAREALSRYQVALDNELYKTLKALREAQLWRMENVKQDGFVFETSSH